MRLSDVERWNQDGSIKTHDEIKDELRMDKKKVKNLVPGVIAVAVIALAIYGLGALIGISVSCCH